jgi:hypothetical protein
MEASGQLHSLTALPTGKSPQYPLDRRLGGSQSQSGCGGEEKIPSSTASRLALGPTQPPTQWVPGSLSLGVKWPGVKLTAHLHLVQRCGAVPPVPQYAFMAWCSFKIQGHLYLTSVLYIQNCIHPLEFLNGFRKLHLDHCG